MSLIAVEFCDEGYDFSSWAALKMQAHAVHRCLTLVLALLCFAPRLPAYSVLTHEAIIDSAWDHDIKPVLLQRFPETSSADLVTAHGYAYAGCILQDMGYYPFGSHFFSDLVHYVRSGDFVLNLIRESQDVNEYAFALGALAHYAADTEGHSIAVNRSVPISFPKLERKFGPVVTYEEKPSAHMRVEFGFDVLQVARGNYAPQSYHDFIGFRVAKPVLERAFRDTYGMELTDIFSDLDLALGTYRHTVSSIIPEMTRVAWNIKKDELIKATPGLTRRRFIYNLSRASYHKEWDKKYQEPGVGSRVLAFLFRVLPKVGPLKTLKFKPPTPQTDKFFETSFDKTLAVYRQSLHGVSAGTLQLADLDFDTGQPTQPGEYRMADDAYSKLVLKLADKDQAAIDPKLRQNILAFYSNLDAPFATKRNPKQWQQTLSALQKLRTAAASPTE